MRLAITVGDDGLGRALREQTARDGHEVLCFGATQGLPAIRGVRDSSVDLNQLANVRYLLTSFRAEAFVHLSWNPRWGEHGDHLDRDGLDLAGRLFRTAYEAGVPHVVGIGSCHEYGPRVGALTEGGDCLPVSRHGLMRQVAHGLLCAIAEEFEASYCWLRAFEIVGGTERPLPCADPSLPEGSPVAPTTSDSARRDFLELGDAARAISHVVEKRLEGPVNLCQGPVCTREDLLRAIAIEARSRGISASRFALKHGAQWIGDPRKLFESGFTPRIRSARQLAHSIVGSFLSPGAGPARPAAA